jgi:hypothetical protein
MFHPKPQMNTMDDWIELSKEHKRRWVEITDRGDMPPTMFAERKGRIICAVVARHVDKYEGLQAAAMLRRACDIDALTMILDAHIRKGKIGQTEEEFRQEMEQYKPGDMQRMCDEEGACSRGEISDCLICHRIDNSGKIKMVILTYDYHGKQGGVEFKWTNYGGDEIRIMDEADPALRLGGNIPDALRQIMALPPLTDMDFVAALGEVHGIGKEQQLYHCTRAIYSILSLKGFLVMDYIGHNLPYDEFKKQQEALEQHQQT